MRHLNFSSISSRCFICSVQWYWFQYRIPSYICNGQTDSVSSYEEQRRRLLFQGRSLWSRVLNWKARSIATRERKRGRERITRIFAKAEQKREGWNTDQGATGNAVKIREGESEWWRRARQPPTSQPIVSEFVYDDSALSKKFLWLTSTSCTRKLAPFNGVLCRSQLGVKTWGLGSKCLPLTDFAKRSARINHISRGPKMVQLLFNDQIIRGEGSRRSSPLRISRSTHARVVSVSANEISQRSPWDQG